MKILAHIHSLMYLFLQYIFSENREHIMGRTFTIGLGSTAGKSQVSPLMEFIKGEDTLHT